MMLNSCSVTKRRYAAGWHVEWHNNNQSHQPEKRQHTSRTSTSTPVLSEEDERAVSRTENQVQNVAGIPAADSTTPSIKNPSTAVTSEMHELDFTGSKENSATGEKLNNTNRRKSHFTTQKERNQAANTDVEQQPEKQSIILSLLIFLACLILIAIILGSTITIPLTVILLIDADLFAIIVGCLFALLVSWIISTEAMVLLSRLLSTNKRHETYTEFRKRILKKCKIIALLIILLPSFIFLVFAFSGVSF